MHCADALCLPRCAAALRCRAALSRFAVALRCADAPGDDARPGAAANPPPQAEETERMVWRQYSAVRRCAAGIPSLALPLPEALAADADAELHLMDARLVVRAAASALRARGPLSSGVPTGLWVPRGGSHGALGSHGVVPTGLWVPRGGSHRDFGPTRRPPVALDGRALPAPLCRVNWMVWRKLLALRSASPEEALAIGAADAVGGCGRNCSAGPPPQRRSAAEICSGNLQRAASHLSYQPLSCHTQAA